MNLRRVAWWYWTATVGLLAVGLCGWTAGVWAAVALTAVQLVHVAALERRLFSLPLQIRAAYVLLLLAGLWPPLAWIHWVQLVGTIAKVVLDYCLLGRVLSLLPWNRSEPLTPSLLRRRFFSVSEPSCTAECSSG